MAIPTNLPTIKGARRSGDDGVGGGRRARGRRASCPTIGRQLDVDGPDGSTATHRLCRRAGRGVAQAALVLQRRVRPVAATGAHAFMVLRLHAACHTFVPRLPSRPMRGCARTSHTAGVPAMGVGTRERATRGGHSGEDGRYTQRKTRPWVGGAGLRAGGGFTAHRCSRPRPPPLTNPTTRRRTSAQVGLGQRG